MSQYYNIDPLVHDDEQQLKEDFFMGLMGEKTVLESLLDMYPEASTVSLELLVETWKSQKL